MRHAMLSLVAAAILAPGLASAQSVEVAPVEAPARENSFFARTSYGHRYDASLSDGPGEFATDEVRAEVGGTVVLDEQFRLLNMVAYNYSNYDSGYINAPVQGLTLATILGIDLERGWSLLVGPMVSFAAEEGADWNESYAAGGLFGATFTASPDLTVGLAVAALSRIEEGASLLPIPMVNWRFAPDWQLYAGMTEVAARRGIGAYLAWNFIKPCELSLGAQFEKRRFRLDSDTGNRNFVAEDSSAPIYARLTVRIVEGLSADIVTGAVVGGELRRNNADDRFLDDRSYAAAPLLGVRVQYAMNLP